MQDRGIAGRIDRRGGVDSVIPIGKNCAAIQYVDRGVDCRALAGTASQDRDHESAKARIEDVVAGGERQNLGRGIVHDADGRG